MARRIATGRTGRAILGSLVTVNNSLQSLITDANVVLEPNGSGITVSTGDLQINSANSLRLAASNSVNSVRLRAPDTVASNVTLTLPATAGSNTQMLQTNGSGALTWAAPFVTVANQTTDTATYYPAITTSTSGSVTGVAVSSSKLTYQPSTGRLSSTEMRVTASTASTNATTGALVVTGGVGIGGSTFCNALTATSITETSSIALKENVAPITGALDSILKLSGVTYDRIDTQEHEAGLIAEWVNEVMPSMVTKDAQGNIVGVKYTKLTAYLIEAVKTLKTEIDELKSK